MRNAPVSRYGSTRLEVLIVTGLIAVVIALLLPAVQTPDKDPTSSSLAASRSRGSTVAKHKFVPSRTARM